MKNKKSKLSMSLSVLIICFLVSSSSLNTLKTKALVEEDTTHFTIDSFDRSTWKWTPTDVISTESTLDTSSPSLAVDSAGKIHVIWYDATPYSGSGSDRDIFYKHWDTSTCWTTTKVVSTMSKNTSRSPSLVVDSASNIYVAWSDETDYVSSGTDYDIFFRRWNSSSSTWSITEVVSTESAGHSHNPSLAVDSAGNIHVVWYDETDYASSGTDWDIFYKRWNSSSSSWSVTEVVSTESTLDTSSPSLAIDSAGNVHIVWMDRTNYDSSGVDSDIFYKYWNSSSSSWSITEVVSTESSDFSFFPSLAVDSVNDLHVAWNDRTNYAGSGGDDDIFYKRWDASSSIWTTTEVVSTESTDDSDNPSLVIDSAGNVNIAWDDLTDYAGAGGDMDIFYKRWESSTSSWTITEVVSTESTDWSYIPSLAVDSAGNVHIAWMDYTNYDSSGVGLDIFYKLLTGPPSAPELAFIIPNPTKPTTIYLNWNNILGANTYNVYRSPSYIWSVEGLTPIKTVSSSEYIDTISSEGFYHYVVVAENFAGISSHSNCQYVHVQIPGLKAPELLYIVPNPTNSSNITLVWDNVAEATEYYIYRLTSYIWSVGGLTPIATVDSTSYISTRYYVDKLPSAGIFFYVIVASDGVNTSTHSNCVYVEYIQVVNETTIDPSLILCVFVFLLVVMRTRKRKPKPN